MRRTLTTICLVFICTTFGLAQEKTSINLYSQTEEPIDFKVAVKKTIEDSTSRYYFPKLKERITQEPAEFTSEDCFYYYYGQIFQKGYNEVSFAFNPERSDFDKAVMSGNSQKILALGVKILTRNPVELTVLLHVCICLKDNKMPDTTYYFTKRYMNLLEAIFSTGDGKSLQTAIKIASIEDDYIIKGVLGFFDGNEVHNFDKEHAYSIWEKGKQKLYFEDVINADRRVNE